MDKVRRKKLGAAKRALGGAPKADTRALKRLAEAVADLRAAGRGFEATHPALTALVDEICRELAELGI